MFWRGVRFNVTDSWRDYLRLDRLFGCRLFICYAFLCGRSCLVWWNFMKLLGRFSWDSPIKAGNLFGLGSLFCFEILALFLLLFCSASRLLCRKWDLCCRNLSLFSRLLWQQTDRFQSTCLWLLTLCERSWPLLEKIYKRMNGKVGILSFSSFFHHVYNFSSIFVNLLIIFVDLKGLGKGIKGYVMFVEYNFLFELIIFE